MPTDAKTKQKSVPVKSDEAGTDAPKKGKPARKSQNAKTAESAFSAAEIAGLQSQLAQKDEVVTALTARLEQAAEQLDRIRRNGGSGRSTRSNGGNLPSELAKEQREITEELQQAVRQWEDMQAGATLGRIEMQVTELRDFIAGRFDDITELGGIAVDRHFAEADSAASFDDTPSAPTASKSSDDPLSAYELLKADLLAGGESPAEKPVFDSATAPSPDDTPSIEPPDADCAKVAVEEVPEANAPIPLDIAEASLEELQSAVETRDAYISYLIRKLRTAESTMRIGGEWAALENVPDELRASLEHLEKRLQDAHRIAEVENSLERARLAREAARLELLDQQMQKKMRQLGIKTASDGEPKVVEAEQPPKKGRSWLRRLGVGRETEGED